MYPLVPAAYHSVPVQATGEGSCWQALCLPVYCPKAAGYRLQVSASLHTMLYPKCQSSSSHAECISLAITHFHDIFGLSDVSTSCVVLLLLSSKQQHWPWSRFWPRAGHFKFSVVNMDFYDDRLDFLSVYISVFIFCPASYEVIQHDVASVIWLLSRCDRKLYFYSAEKTFKNMRIEGYWF